jgi:hypothetical protein
MSEHGALVVDCNGILLRDPPKSNLLSRPRHGGPGGHVVPRPATRRTSSGPADHKTASARSKSVGFWRKIMAEGTKRKNRVGEPELRSLWENNGQPNAACKSVQRDGYP